jgi:arylsulfatase
MEERPVIAADRTSYTYFPDTQAVATNAAVRILNRSHSITAYVEIPEGGASGVLLAHGGIDSGYAFYLKDGRLKWCHNYVDRERYYVESPEPVSAGAHELRFEFEVTSPPDISEGKGAGGNAQLYVDGALVAAAEVPTTTPLALGLTGGVLCGRATGAPVTPDYAPPAVFTGKLHKVVVDVSGELITDDDATLRMLMARQ